MKHFLFAIFLFLMSTSRTYAGYNANFTGKVTNVLTYPYTTLILIRVSNQPKTHPTCTKLNYLAIAPDVSPESRQLVMSRLLLAYASGEQVNIGYDKDGGCYNGYIQVHRVG